MTKRIQSKKAPFLNYFAYNWVESISTSNQVYTLLKTLKYMKTLIVCYQCILNLGLYLEYGNPGLFIDYLARSLNNK